MSYWKPISSNYGHCQNVHWRFKNGNMACNACGVFYWKLRKWVGGYHEAQNLIQKMPKPKTALDALSAEDIERILNE